SRTFRSRASTPLRLDAVTSTLASDRVAEPAEPSPAARASELSVAARALEAAALGLEPVLVFVIYRVHPMVKVDTIDPTLYTAYIQNGPDIMRRLGPDHYYWSRLGMVIPARVAFLLFGAIPGFYVLRYLLCLVAIVPAYVLFTRLPSRAAGALSVAV